VSKQGSSISLPEERLLLARKQTLIEMWGGYDFFLVIGKGAVESSAAWRLPERKPNLRLSKDCHLHRLESLPAHTPSLLYT